MIWTLLAILAAACLAPFVVRVSGRAAPWLLGMVPFAAGVWFLTTFLAGGTPTADLGAWAPELGVRLALRADGLSSLFATLVGCIGGLVTLYAGGYLSGHPRLGGFYVLLLVFIAAMLGLVISDDLLLLFVCWELTSITSFLLIGFEHARADARAAAQKALLTTGLGGLALMGGLVILVQMGRRAGLGMAEATSISMLMQHGDALRADPLYPAALVLILLGCFTKSAQVPFHFWLPAAMAGPTPVSALLHSATMVKAGVYLLARLQIGLGHSPLWVAALTTIGTLTMVTGALRAVHQRDLKAILAYTTISGLGTLVMLLGISSDSAIEAMIVFLTVHALYKAALFMVVGNVDHEAGTRELDELGGLWRAMPVTALAAMLAALGQAGAPPALGYMGKKVALLAKLDFVAFGEWLTIAAVVTNIAMVAVALGIAVRPFWGRMVVPIKRAHEAPPSMLLGPVLLGALGILIGLVPGLFDQGIGVAAASAVAGRPLVMKLKMWSGLNLESMFLLVISVVGFGAGVALYRRLHLVWHLPHLPGSLQALRPTRLYERGWSGVLDLAGRHTRAVQRGSLRFYVAVSVLAAAAMVLPWLLPALRETNHAAAPNAPPDTILLTLLIIAGSVGSLLAHRPITAAVCIGVTGLGIALVFGFFGGVDLAITQLLVETLVVLLLAGTLVHLPRTVRAVSTPARLRDAGIAGVGGLLAGGVVFVAAASDRTGSVAESMLRWAVPEAHGRNVVNVILVDFRALDTLGEITVVAAAVLGLWGLLCNRPRLPPPAGLAPQDGAREPRVDCVLDWLPLRAISLPVMALLLTVSLVALLRGHNEPGGGFIAGLLAASGVAVHALAHGTAAARRVLRVPPQALVAVGLLTALVSGLLGLIEDSPFLAGQWWTSVPALGKLSSVLLFDVGVYLVVFGGVVLTLLQLLENPWDPPIARREGTAAGSTPRPGEEESP